MTRRLKSVRIQDIKGVQLLTFEAGAVTVISGKNGAGKSSAIDAHLSLFEGGHDPGLIFCPVKLEKGPAALAHPPGRCDRCAEFGLIEWKLDDGTTISKKVTEKASTLKITTQDGGLIPAPAAWLKKLATSLQFNPARFITSTGKERASEITKVMPVLFTGKEVSYAAGEPGMLPDSEVVPLDRLNQIRDGRYEKRRDINREWETIAGQADSAERILKSLPDDAGVDYSGVVEMLRGQVSEAKASLEKQRGEMGHERSFRLQGMEAVHNEAKTKLQAEHQARLREMAEAHAVEVATVNREHEEKLAEVTSEVSTQNAELAGELAKAEAALAEQQRTSGMRRQLTEQATTLRARSQELGRVHKGLDAAVPALDKLKNSKLALLPVPGVEVRQLEKGPEVFVDGIAWPHVNKSMQCRVAISIAAQALGDLPLMVLDEAEVLDGDTLAALVDAAKGIGLQVIMARVETGRELTAAQA